MLRELINTSEKTMVIVDQIKIDGGTQMRAGLDDATVREYADAMADGGWGSFPPVVLYHDGTDYWLADGFHRMAAYRGLVAIGDTLIPADVRVGTRRDAILHAAGANANHGLRRTKADKRRAVETLLRDKEWGKWSDREIGRQCDVDHKTVGVIRQQLSGEIPQIEPERTVQRGGQVYTQNTTNIGANRPPARKTQPAIEEHNAGTIALSSPAADPWAAAWAMLHPTEFPDERRRRLSEAMLSWALAWDDDGRTWRDVVDRNPQHANSPFRQAAEIECRRHGLNIEGHHMQDVIRKLFFRLININPIRPTATQITTTGAAEKFSITDWELSDICETVAGEFYGADALDRLITYVDMDTVAATCSGGYWEKLQPVLQYYDLTDERIAAGIRAAIERMMAERGLTTFKPGVVENKRPVAAQSPISQPPISQSPAYAEVWQIEQALRGWSAMQAPAELRTLARFRGGARWFEVRKLLGGLSYRDRDLVQALNDLANIMERPTPAIEQTIAMAPAFVLPASTPTPATEPTSAPISNLPDDRTECAQQLIGIYQAAIETEETYGALTGCYTEWLAPRRELQKLIDHLQRLVDLLTGQIDDTVGSENGNNFRFERHSAGVPDTRRQPNYEYSETDAN